MADLCKNLDKLVSDYFAVLDEVFKEYRELETLIGHGFLYMGQARKSMGVKRLSADQYDYDSMKASVGVLISESEGLTNFEKCDLEAFHDKHEKSGPEVDKGLRKRKKGDSQDEKEHIEEITDSVKNMKVNQACNGTKKFDPIRMFGILVPQSLRQCQDKFSRIIDITVKIASLKSELISIKKQYQEQLKHKPPQTDDEES